MNKAQQIADTMYQDDAFSKWLGIDILEMKVGYTKIQMKVRQEMTNGFGIAHGGITYSLSDSAFAFASNSQGRHAVSIETSISHIRRVNVGDVLTAVAREEHLSNKIAVYRIEVTNQRDEKVALFKGTVYRTSKEWTNAKLSDF